MALITCPDCSNQISSKAKACPTCGCPVTGEMRGDIALTQTSNGFHLNVGKEEAFRICISAAEIMRTTYVPEVKVFIDQGVIRFEATKERGGWWPMDPIVRDSIFVETIEVSSDTTLLSIYWFTDNTQQVWGDNANVGFINAVYKLITGTTP